MEVASGEKTVANQPELSSSSVGVSLNKPTSKVICNFCNKEGHRRQNCWKRYQQRSKPAKKTHGAKESKEIPQSSSVAAQVNSRRFTGQVYRRKEKEVRQSSSSSPFASPTSSELRESDVFYLQEKKDVVFAKGEKSKRGPNMRNATCARCG